MISSPQTTARISKRLPSHFGAIRVPPVLRYPVFTSTRQSRRSNNTARSQAQLGDIARKTAKPFERRSVATISSEIVPVVEGGRPRTELTVFHRSLLLVCRHSREQKTCSLLFVSKGLRQLSSRHVRESLALQSRLAMISTE